MLTWELVRVVSFTDRDRAEAVAGEIRRAGIPVFLFPSDRAISRWDLEVPAADAAAVLGIVERTRTR